MAKAQPIRITTVGRSRADDIAARQKRYTISMSIRTICFIGAVVAGLAHVTWLWPILIVAALFLPYVAVVMANNTDRRHDDGTALLGAPPGRQLPAAPEQQTDEDGHVLTGEAQDVRDEPHRDDA